MRNQEDVAAMQCPVCRTPLAMSDRQGIEIDYCPQCRGVWLDRGELDKIIERSAPAIAPAAAAGPTAAAAAQPRHQSEPPLHPGNAQNPWAPQGYTHGGFGHGGGHSDGYRGKPYKKRKSWLEEIFD